MKHLIITLLLCSTAVAQAPTATVTHNGSGHRIDVHVTILIDGHPVPPGPLPPGPGPLPIPPGPQPPTPIPPVPPTPPPAPVLPDGQFGISRFVRDEASKVNSPNRSAEAQKVAQQLDAIGARIAAGTLSGPSAIMSAVSDANRQALGSSLPLWEGFGSVLGDKIKGFYLGGQLASNGAWSTLFSEIALGLKAVK